MSRGIWVETAESEGFSSVNTRKNLVEALPQVYKLSPGGYNCIYYGMVGDEKLVGQAVRLTDYGDNWPDPGLAKRAVTIFEMKWLDSQGAEDNRFNGFIRPADEWLDVIGSDRFFSINQAGITIKGISFSNAEVANIWLSKGGTVDIMMSYAGLQIQAEQAIKLIEALAKY